MEVPVRMSASPETVRALTVTSARAHRNLRLSESVREHFWSIPLVLILLGVLAGAVVSRPDIFGLPSDWHVGHAVRTSTADAMLQLMAASMLTFVGVVFAIT